MFKVVRVRVGVRVNLRSHSICPFWPAEKNWFWPIFNAKTLSARAHFFPILVLWPRGAGELYGSEPRVGPFWSEPVLRTPACVPFKN